MYICCDHYAIALSEMIRNIKFDNNVLLSNRGPDYLFLNKPQNCTINVNSYLGVKRINCLVASGCLGH